MSESIKIAVRVRPFNSNEEGQSKIVEMDGQETRIKNPDNGEIKKFGFHRCYWSADNSKNRVPVNNMFVFNDIGKQILNQIYGGYNSTVFAYGQTGAGKSYSIEGYEEKGILQLCLSDIFKRKKIENDAQGLSTSIKVQYLEIYNEKLRDLLNPNERQEIKIQSVGTSVFISGSNPVLCESYEEVLRMFEEGKKIRVIGAHAMNKNSSRSHAVFTIYYKQIGKGKVIESKFNIVDLAGSERQSKTGATGKRLQEANSINKSLTNLGIVIETLATNCLKKLNNFVPYRNSMLTHILSQSLGGNSKTFMIAAISPASSNFEQTLSTLRFAQRASMITTKSKKNVEHKQGYNKELVAEIQRLKEQLDKASGKTSVQYMKVEDQSRIQQLQSNIQAMLGELEKNKEAMKDLEMQLQEQRKRKQQMEENRKKALKDAGLSVDKSMNEDKLPYIMNISEDPTLAGMLMYKLKLGQIKIGTNEAEDNDIKLNALGIMKKHCTITHKNNEIFITPNQQCKVFVNGLNVVGRKKINHLDRITLGHANMFKLIIPGQKAEVVKNMGRYGQFLDDRLNSDCEDAKNTKIFIQQLEHRLDKDTFARFLEKFKAIINDVDEANDYTNFRYKKYPLKSRNIHFRLNVLIDIQNYLRGLPSFIILSQHKQTGNIEFIWSETKFQERLAKMQSWYADVNKSSQNNSSFYEFDPWFEATDGFIKEKEEIQLMDFQQIHQFLSKKQNENSEIYSNLMQQQKQILKGLQKIGANPQLVEDYGDYYFRGYEIPLKNKQICEKMRKNEEAHTQVKRFMECCAQVQQCNIDTKALNEAKRKYRGEGNEGNYKQVRGSLEENIWLKQEVEELRNKVQERQIQIRNFEAMLQEFG